MSFNLILLRPDAPLEDRHPKPEDRPWEDANYVGNREFHLMVLEDAEFNDNGLFGDRCIRPKNFAALRKRVQNEPPAGSTENVALWLELIDVLEKDPTLWLDWC